MFVAALVRSLALLGRDALLLENFSAKRDCYGVAIMGSGRQPSAIIGNHEQSPRS